MDSSGTLAPTGDRYCHKDCCKRHEEGRPCESLCDGDCSWDGDNPLNRLELIFGERQGARRGTSAAWIGANPCFTKFLNRTWGTLLEFDYSLWRTYQWVKRKRPASSSWEQFMQREEQTEPASTPQASCERFVRLALGSWRTDRPRADPWFFSCCMEQWVQVRTTMHCETCAACHNVDKADCPAVLVAAATGGAVAGREEVRDDPQITYMARSYKEREEAKKMRRRVYGQAYRARKKAEREERELAQEMEEGREAEYSREVDEEDARRVQAMAEAGGAGAHASGSSAPREL